MADSHYLIEKKETEGCTTTTVSALDREASYLEVARLIGGEEITETALAAAKELCDEKDMILY